MNRARFVARARAAPRLTSAPAARRLPEADILVVLDEPAVSRATPRISVLIPAYNAGAYLRQTLSSALDQVPPPHEVLVQDGGSTDQTLEILRSFGDRVAWVSGRDRGQADALNKALARASGDVVLWLNADDVILPGTVAVGAEAFAADRELAFAYGDFDIIDGAGALMRHYRSSLYSWSRVFARGCYIFSGSVFIRKEALQAVGGFDSSLHACMDLDLLLRLDAAGPSRHVQRTIGQFRMHGSNKSMTMPAVFVREGFRVRRRYTRRSLRLWLVALRIAVLGGCMLPLTPLRYSSRWPRHGRGKTL
jgi:glycosyltransferase involved in cell wall biosynthesis